MKEIYVASKLKSYNIFIGENIFKNVQSYIENTNNNYKKIFILSDENVWGFYGDIFLTAFKKSDTKIITYILPSGEQNKSFEIFEKVAGFMALNNICRDDLLIAFGGGVIGDLGGFCASVYMRGIDYIQVPTTLLSQVDSSVGGKTAINLPQGKNLLGSFYSPSFVIADTKLLETLPTRELASGMAEVIKYAILYSDEFFDFLYSLNSKEKFFENAEEIVYKCCNFKKNAVESDEFDKGNRVFLNLGHTFAHAIEKQGNFSQYTHGEAVGMGLYLAAIYSKIKFNNSEINLEKIKSILIKFSLPTCEKLDFQGLCKNFAYDKKSHGSCLTLVLIKKIGDCFTYNIDIDEFINDIPKLENFIKEGEYI